MKFTDDYVDAQGPFCWIGDRPSTTEQPSSSWGWDPASNAMSANPWWNTLDEDQANIVGNAHDWPGGTLESLMKPRPRANVVTNFCLK